MSPFWFIDYFWEQFLFWEALSPPKTKQVKKQKNPKTTVIGVKGKIRKTKRWLWRKNENGPFFIFF